jgi:hypothetical protein
MTVVVLGAAVGPAAASWNLSGPGAGAGRGAGLQPPTAGSGTTTSAGAHLTWAPPSTGPVPGGYVVTRNGATVCTTTGTMCDENNLVPGTTYTYLVNSTSGHYWVSATPVTITATTAAGTFTLSALNPTAVSAGVQLTFTVSAKYGGTPGTTDAAYTGAHPLTISSSIPASPGGKASGGQVTPTFAAGVATGVATTLYGSGTQTLTVADGARSGSVAVTVSAAAPSTPEIVSSTSTTVLCTPNGHVSIPAGQQWTARVAVADAYGNLAVAGSTLTVGVSYTGYGTLSKTAATIASGSSVANQTFSLAMPASGPKNGTLSITAQGTTTLSTQCTVN